MPAGPALDAINVGGLVHRVLAQCLPGRVSERDIASEVWRQLQRCGTRNPAMRNRATLLCRRYVDRFHPGPSATLVGTEMTVANVRFDAVWRTGHGVWADEIKTGPHAPAGQLHRQLLVGHERWGDAFLGVRVLLLGSPAASSFVRRERTR